MKKQSSHIKSITLIGLVACGIAMSGRFAEAQNRVLSLDGSGDYVMVPHNASLNLTNTFTVEAWIAFQPGVPDAKRLVSKGWENEYPEGYEFGLSLGAQTGSLFFGPMVGSGGQDLFFGNGLITNNVWTHVAAMFDGTTLRLLTNGVVDSSATTTRSSLPATTWPLAIGCISTIPTWGNYKGFIDEVRIWNRARSISEIQANM